jgi:hypothetical protein
MDNHTLNKQTLTDTPAKKQCDKCHEVYNFRSFARHYKACPFAAFKHSKNQLLDLERGLATPHPTDTNKDLNKDDELVKLTLQLEEFKKELAILKEQRANVTPHPQVNLNLADFDEKFEVFRSRLRNDQQAIFVWTEFKKFIEETGREVNLGSGNTFVARLNNKVNIKEIKGSSAKTYMSLLNSILSCFPSL